MAEISHNAEVAGVPFDRTGELTAWRPVDTIPTAADGDRFTARTYSAGGYRSVDAGNRFLGLRGYTVHAVIAPDYDAMTGVGRCALVYRGHGGPTAGAYWAWGVELERNGNQVDVYSVHQNQVGTFVSQFLGAFEVGFEWLALAVSREDTPDGFQARTWVDGKRLGEVITVTNTAATPGEPVTLGVRLVAAETGERYFRGRIERVVVQGEAATDEQVRHQHAALIGAYADAYDTVAAYFPRGADTRASAAYGRYRVRPLAEMRTLFEAGCQRFVEAALPPTAYGPHLVAFETVLELSPSPTDTVEQRQAAAQAALAGSLDLTPTALQAVAAQLFGVAEGSVEILEGANYFNFPLTGAGELAGPPWRVRGPVDATTEAGGLTLHVPAGRDLRYEPSVERSVFLELGIHHYPRPGDVAREEDHRLAVVLESATGFAEDTWFGLHLTSPTGDVRWVGYNGTGLYQRSWTSNAGLSAPSELAAMVSVPLEIALEFISDTSIGGGRWDVRWRTPGTGPGNWTTVSLAVSAGGDDRVWLGIGISSALSATLSDCDVLVSAATFQAGDSPAWAYWQAYSDAPAFRAQVAHSQELDRKGRAVSYGAATYERYAIADTDGAAFDYTPTVVSQTRIPFIGFDGAQAAQMTGLYPTHLWTMQESDSPLVDHVGAADLDEGATVPLYEQDGPDGLFAVGFVDDDNQFVDNALGILDIVDSTTPVLLAGIVKLSGLGPIWSKEQTTTHGWRLRRNSGNLTLSFQSGIVTTVSATLTDASSGYQDDTWFALVAYLENTGGGNARVTVATSQGSAVGSGAVGTSNTGRFRLGSALSADSAEHHQRWLMAVRGGEAVGKTPTNIANIAARLAAAAGVA